MNACFRPENPEPYMGRVFRVRGIAGVVPVPEGGIGAVGVGPRRAHRGRLRGRGVRGAGARARRQQPRAARPAAPHRTAAHAAA